MSAQPTGFENPKKKSIASSNIQLPSTQTATKKSKPSQKKPGINRLNLQPVIAQQPLALTQLQGSKRSRKNVLDANSTSSSNTQLSAQKVDDMEHNPHYISVTVGQALALPQSAVKGLQKNVTGPSSNDQTTDDIKQISVKTQQSFAPTQSIRLKRPRKNLTDAISFISSNLQLLNAQTADDKQQATVLAESKGYKRPRKNVTTANIFTNSNIKLSTPPAPHLPVMEQKAPAPTRPEIKSVQKHATGANSITSSKVQLSSTRAPAPEGPEDLRKNVTATKNITSWKVGLPSTQTVGDIQQNPPFMPSPSQSKRSKRPRKNETFASTITSSNKQKASSMQQNPPYIPEMVQQVPKGPQIAVNIVTSSNIQLQSAPPPPHLPFMESEVKSVTKHVTGANSITSSKVQLPSTQAARDRQQHPPHLAGMEQVTPAPEGAEDLRKNVTATNLKVGQTVGAIQQNPYLMSPPVQSKRSKCVQKNEIPASTSISPIIQFPSKQKASGMQQNTLYIPDMPVPTQTEVSKGPRKNVIAVNMVTSSLQSTPPPPHLPVMEQEPPAPTQSEVKSVPKYVTGANSTTNLNVPAAEELKGPQVNVTAANSSWEVGHPIRQLLANLRQTPCLVSPITQEKLCNCSSVYRSIMKILNETVENTPDIPDMVQQVPVPNQPEVKSVSKHVTGANSITSSKVQLPSTQTAGDTQKNPVMEQLTPAPDGPLDLRKNVTAAKIITSVPSTQTVGDIQQNPPFMLPKRFKDPRKNEIVASILLNAITQAIEQNTPHIPVVEQQAPAPTVPEFKSEPKNVSGDNSIASLKIGQPSSQTVDSIQQNPSLMPQPTIPKRFIYPQNSNVRPPKRPKDLRKHVLTANIIANLKVDFMKKNLVGGIPKIPVMARQSPSLTQLKKTQRLRKKVRLCISFINSNLQLLFRQRAGDMKKKSKPTAAVQSARARTHSKGLKRFQNNMKGVTFFINSKLRFLHKHAGGKKQKKPPQICIVDMVKRARAAIRSKKFKNLRKNVTGENSVTSSNSETIDDMEQNAPHVPVMEQQQTEGPEDLRKNVTGDNSVTSSNSETIGDMEQNLPVIEQQAEGPKDLRTNVTGENSVTSSSSETAGEQNPPTQPNSLTVPRKNTRDTFSQILSTLHFIGSKIANDSQPNTPRIGKGAKIVSSLDVGLMRTKMTQLPVMAEEVLHGLNPQPNQIILDMTFGTGGHSRKILASAPNIKLLVLDGDRTAITYMKKLFDEYPNQVTRLHSRFSELPIYLEAHGGKNSIDGILCDFGYSYLQLNDPERGFSVSQNGPLDMKMNRNYEGPTVADALANLSEEVLYQILLLNGNEKHAREIAQAIVEQRKKSKPLKTTQELADLVDSVYKDKNQVCWDKLFMPMHNASKTFQALRYFINDDLNEIKSALALAEKYLKVGGRLVTITYSLLEEEIVSEYLCADRGNDSNTMKPNWKCLHVEPNITPKFTELKYNARSRSAKLRATMKVK